MPDDKVNIFYELFERRRSVREFGPAPVEPDKLSRLLTALNRAQSAANRQPWHFIVIERKGPHAIDAIFMKEGFKAAPLIIAACAEPAKAWVRKADNVNYAWVDVTIALTEMITVATAEGLGTCWIAAIDPLKVREILGIPGQMEVVGLIAIGYPKEELKREDKNRKPLKEIIHYDRWQG
ncbi:MAG: nitroreductase family protein [Deltaproteobacteria bacterium]|nr:nitroreductase family protein [Deltaproteobacteria bacterium]